MTDLPGRPSRRTFLKASAATVTIAGMPIAAHAQKEPEPVALEDYKPEFFSAEEWAFAMAACARLIPSEGDGPGAIEARVPVFIDRQLAGDFGKAADWYMEGPYDPSADPYLGYQTPLTPAEVYRKAIPVFDKWCADNKGGGFVKLKPEDQDGALQALEMGSVGMPPEQRDFFSLLWQNVREGYFADPQYGGNHQMQAWVYIGFPGARGSYLSWVERHNTKYPLGPVSISGERA